MSKVISRLIWFCIAALCVWLKNIAPLYHFIKSKTNHDFPVRVFPHLVSATCTDLFQSSSDWFIGLSASVVIGQSLLLFWYYDTELKTALVRDLRRDRRRKITINVRNNTLLFPFNQCLFSLFPS